MRKRALLTRCACISGYKKIGEGFGQRPTPEALHGAGGVLLEGGYLEAAPSPHWHFPKNKNAGEIMEIAQKLARRRGVSLYLD